MNTPLTQRTQRKAAGTKVTRGGTPAPHARMAALPSRRAILRLPRHVEFEPEDQLFHCYAAFLATLGVDSL